MAFNMSDEYDFSLDEIQVLTLSEDDKKLIKEIDDGISRIDKLIERNIRQFEKEYERNSGRIIESKGFPRSQKETNQLLSKIARAMEGFQGEKKAELDIKKVMEENRVKQQERDDEKRKDDLSMTKETAEDAHELEIKKIEVESQKIKDDRKASTLKTKWIIGGVTAIIITLIETLSRIL